MATSRFELCPVSTILPLTLPLENIGATCQPRICSLTTLQLSAHGYRTKSSSVAIRNNAECVRVQKEWAWFTNKFYQRNVWKSCKSCVYQRVHHLLDVGQHVFLGHIEPPNACGFSWKWANFQLLCHKWWKRRCADKFIWMPKCKQLDETNLTKHDHHDEYSERY